MLPPERGIVVRGPVGGLLLGLVVMVAMAGCNRLSFIKPDYTRSDFRRTAPELDVVPDDRSTSTVQARTAVRQGQLAYTKGDLDGARKAAVGALKSNPDFAAAHTLRALVADADGEVEVAGDHYRRAIELSPHDGGTLNNYGTWLCANGREQESLQWFDRALADRGYRTPAAAMANAGACAVKAGQGGLAVKYLDAALAIDPQNPVALAAMAEHEFRAGRAFHARAFSQRRLAAAPADARSLLLASQIEEKLGDKDAADGYVQRLRAEFPDISGSGAGENGKR